MIGIYKITAPDGKVYIGQSVDIKKRWKSFKNKSVKDQPRIYASILKYGVGNHLFEVVELCKKEELDEKEVYYINLYDSIVTGLNCKHGGHNAGLQGESVVRLSASLVETNKRPEVKERRSAWQRGRKMSKEACENMSKAKKGKPATQAQKDCHKGNNYAQKEPVGIYKDGILVIVKENLYQAAEFVNGDYRNVHRAIKNPKKAHHKGYSFNRMTHESSIAAMV